MMPPESQGGSGGGFEPQGDEARGRSSVNLREGSPLDPSEDSPLDPANQSLSDAIRITFRILQGAMVILAGLYVLSGLQFVKEGEQGIRLLFGRISAAHLDPGLQYSLPFPLGELVKVNKGTKEVRLETPFWIAQVAGTPRDTPLDKLTPNTSLKPSEESGSVLTGDGAIAHMRVVASYHREGASNYAMNVLPDHEDMLVRRAIQRGIVQAVSETTIQDLIHQSGSGAGSVAFRAKATAQAMLTALATGLTIDNLNLENPMPPVMLRADFANAQTEATKAGQARDAAQRDADTALNVAAGRGAKDVIAAIDAYEAALKVGDVTSRDAALKHVDEMLLGNGADHAAQGRVGSMLSEAVRYRSQIIASRKAELSQFNAKLGQFQANPLAMINREWQDAMTELLARDTVQVLQLPPNTSTLQLTLNADPEILKGIMKAIRLENNKKAEEQRLKELHENRFDTKGLNTMGS